MRPGLHIAATDWQRRPKRAEIVQAADARFPRRLSSDTGCILMVWTFVARLR